MMPRRRPQRSSFFIFTSSLALGVLPGLSLVAGCDKTNPDDFVPPLNTVTFPRGFRWGSSTSAFQTEKGNAHTDWGHWVQTTGKIKNGDNPDVGGPDSLDHIDDDVNALKETGQNAYRFSIEWGHLYPQRADFDADKPDPAVLASYDSLVSKLRAAGIRPMMTLQHFSLPDYLSDVTQPGLPQGWERPETTDLFVQFCTRMATHFKASVDDWITINEPFVTALTGYITGAAPPGVLLDTNRAFAVVKAEAQAHAKCFEAIHKADDADADGDGISAWVSVADNHERFLPLDATNADDAKAAQHAGYIWNQWFYNAVVKGDWDDDFDGKYDGPNDKTGDPTLAKHADFLGINYYTDVLVSAHNGIVVPGLGFSALSDHLPTSLPKTDNAEDIDPAGLRTVLVEAGGYGLPIIVTENGLADGADKNRARFITEHLYQAGLAIQGGVDLRGYYQWSLVDNFEWDSGFCPKFGMYSVDSATGARTKRASADAYNTTREQVAGMLKDIGVTSDQLAAASAQMAQTSGDVGQWRGAVATFLSIAEGRFERLAAELE